ncbi:hypothetical protein LTR36_005148 [Oleoguttula mirabilis]|uniref:Uncharacterized protein n=1 Tax=Oleoguttula mirabilis TaxID=1507867 RepID=A0AAV9JWE3_9PEZI|nr:hypothetical protein LTR36_005148 [Oleoguttula mirabilis]
MSRVIVITEQIELHLVWTKRRIFIKPLPRYLLDIEIRNIHIECHPELAKCVRGLLHSYTALFAYESDFRIAHDEGLLPVDMDWVKWHTTARTFVKDCSDSSWNIYNEIDGRYLYGELRLSRLNKIYRGLRGELLYGYSHETAQSLYGVFFAENFGKVAAILAYSMQVGLADDLVSGNQAFRKAYYGFAVFSIFSPLVAALALVAVFLLIFVAHWARTHWNAKKRYEEMGI